MKNENTIEKQIELKAPVSKVWNALTDSKQFGQWFGVQFNEPFVANRSAHGKLTFESKKGFEMEFQIKDIKPETYFSYAWHPFPFDKSVDYKNEKPTLIEFRLEATKVGTLLTVKESGFDHITAHRRAEALKMNTGGWEAQLKNIEKFLA